MAYTLIIRFISKRKVLQINGCRVYGYNSDDEK